MRNVYKILARKHEGNRPFGGPRYKWEDNINVGLKEIGCELNSYGHKYNHMPTNNIHVMTTNYS
jgi:hypothetical protein